MPYIPIIGRDNEIHQIDEHIHARSPRHLICITGPGGIGKTRLLQEVRERYLVEFTSSETKNYWVSEIISFDDPSLHIADNIRRLLIRYLGNVHFERYFQSLADWYRMKEAGIGRDRLSIEEGNVNESFISDFNMLSKKHRIILFFDTIDDEMEKTDSWNYLVDLIPDLDNVVILVAGRVADKFHAEISRHPNVNSSLIELHPLDEDASLEYFQRKQKNLHISVDPLISNRIIKLAKGRPILIDLAVEWMARDIPLPWLENQLDDSELERFEPDFEKQLIAPVGELRSSIERLILVASYIYPLSEKFISYLFGINIVDAHMLFQNALSGYVYFKPIVHSQLTLHDEVRRMVNRWIWDAIDPGGERRRDYSERFVRFAENEVVSMRENLKKATDNDYSRQRGGLLGLTLATAQVFQDEIDREDLWAMEILRLDHTLRTDIEKGFAVFEDLYDKATSDYLFSVRRELLNLVGKLANRLSDYYQAKLDLFVAESNYEGGEPDLAYNLLEKYITRNDVDDLLRVRILITVGNSLIRRGRIDDADKILTEASRLSASINATEYRGKAELTLGWLRRLQGKWEQASKLYSSALDYCFQVNDLVNAAILLNSIGYINCLRGDYLTGRSSCIQALDIFERFSRPREKAMVYSTLGEIYTSSEQFGEAMKSYSQALEIFEAAEDWEWICILQHEIAHSLWIQNRFEEAWKNISESLSIAESHKIWKEIPTIYYHMGWINWDHVKFDELGETEYTISTRYFLRSYEESIRYRDKFRQLGALVALAEISRVFGKFEIVGKYAEELNTEISVNKLDFPLLQGQMERILGNVDYERAQTASQRNLYAKALNHYAKAIPLIATHGGTGRYSLVNELLFLGDRIDDLDPELSLSWCNKMRSKWSKNRKILRKHPELINFCEVHAAIAKAKLNRIGA